MLGITLEEVKFMLATTCFNPEGDVGDDFPTPLNHLFGMKLSISMANPRSSHTRNQPWFFQHTSPPLQPHPTRNPTDFLTQHTFQRFRSPFEPTGFIRFPTFPTFSSTTSTGPNLFPRLQVDPKSCLFGNPTRCTSGGHEPQNRPLGGAKHGFAPGCF